MKPYLLILVMLLMTPAVGVPKTWDCKIYNTFPVLVEGCQGEACGILRYEKAVRDAILYEKPNLDSLVVDRLKKCEKLSDFKAHILLKGYGRAKVTHVGTKARELGVKEGDFLPILKSLGEGYLEACINQEVVSVVEVNSAGATDTAVGDITFPNAESWIKITSPRKVSGYAKDSDFYMGYYSYEPKNFCGSDHPLGTKHAEIEVKIADKLTKAFQTHCAESGNCDLAKDPTRVCPLESRVWSDVIPSFPSGIQCAAFHFGQGACGNRWSGHFSCAFLSKNEGDQQIHYSFLCNKGEKTISCSLQ